MAILPDEKNELCASQIVLVPFIDTLDPVIQDVHVEEESVLHAALLSEGIEVFGEFTEALVKEIWQSAFHAPAFVDL